MSCAASTFDTLQFANRLKAVGVPEKQAEIQAELWLEQREAINEFVDDSLATKQDIAGLKRDMKELEVTLRRDIKEMSYQIVIKLGSMIAGSVVLLGVLLPIMSKFLGGH
ncbi:MAG: hypothetical protein A2X78_01190 [Gammaproteobacteria bacterium GWE2_37_16]|nr:MAG: hypothetical protein A2X78_01190 [Gammaproteobacteria bacterium GWE2_37_16]